MRVFAPVAFTTSSGTSYQSGWLELVDNLALTLAAEGKVNLPDPSIAPTFQTPVSSRRDAGGKVVGMTASCGESADPVTGVIGLDSPTLAAVRSTFPLQGASTVLVAASNSSKLDKNAAAFVCSGVNDEQVINALTNPGIVNNIGLTVMLADGTYNLGATSGVVIDNDHVTLSGTRWTSWGGYNNKWTNTSTPTGAIGIGGALIQAGGNYNIIELKSNVPGGTGLDTRRHRGIHIKNLYIVGNNYTGTAIYNNTSTADHDMCSVENVMIHRVQHGIQVRGDVMTVRGCSVQDITGDAYTFWGQLGEISDSIAWDIGGNGMNINSVGYTVGSGCMIGNTAGVGLIVNADGVKVGLVTFGNCLGGDMVINGKGCSIPGISVDKLSANYGYNVNAPIYLPSVKVSSTGSAAIGIATFLTAKGRALAIDASASPGTVIGTVLTVGPWGYGGQAPVSGGQQSNILASFVPTNNPAVITTGRLQARFRAADITGITSGNAIATWPDAAGYARDLLPVGGAPKYIAASNINGGPAVRFNGTSDILGEASMILPGQPITIFAVVNPSSSASTLGRNSSIVNSSGAASTTNALTLDSATNKVGSYAGTYTVSNSATVTAGNTYVIMIVYNGASSRVSVNGAVTANFNPGANNWGVGMTVGANAGRNGEWFAGDISEIDVLSGALSNADAALVGAALCTAFGVTNGGSW